MVDIQNATNNQPSTINNQQSTINHQSIMKFTVEELLSKLPLPADEKWKDGVWDVEPFTKRGVRLVFFAPRGNDYQTAHDEDEFYFVVRGSGKLVIEGEPFDCTTGDAFFVAAGQSHHFEAFTDDFATWAIFF